MNHNVLISQEFVIIHHIQQKIILLRECCLVFPPWEYPLVVMLRLSALLYIPIDLMEFIPLILIKVASHSGLVPPALVIDPKPEGLNTD